MKVINMKMKRLRQGVYWLLAILANAVSEMEWIPLYSRLKIFSFLKSLANIIAAIRQREVKDDLRLLTKKVETAINLENVDELAFLFHSDDRAQQVRVFGLSPLEFAISASSLSCVRFILESGADPRITGLLHNAESLDIAKLLIANGADPTKPDELGRLPLSVAAARGAGDVALYLLTLQKPISRQCEVRARLFRHVSVADALKVELDRIDDEIRHFVFLVLFRHDLYRFERVRSNILEFAQL